MRLAKIASAVAGAAALALVVSGCGSSSTTTASSASSAAESAIASATAQAGSALSSAKERRRASAVDSAKSQASSAIIGAVGDSQVLTSAEGGKLVVGIKYDQPGLGLKNPDGSFSGFDVEVAKYVADKLGVPADSIEFKEAKSAEREGLIERGEVDYIVATYSITDTRKEKVNFAGPYFIAAPGPAGQGRQHRHHRPGGDGRQDPLLGDRLDVGAEGQGQLRGGRGAAGVRHLHRMRRGADSPVRSTRSPPTTSSWPATRRSTPASSRLSARASPTRTTASV